MQRLQLTPFSLCPTAYLLMRWAFKSHLGDGLSGACSGGRLSGSVGVHRRLPHLDEDEAVAIIGRTGHIKDRGAQELVPLVGRI